MREIDPSRVISHRISIDEVPDAFRAFRDKEDECIKYVVSPDGGSASTRGHQHGHESMPLA